MITPTHVVTNAFVARRARGNGGGFIGDKPGWFVLGGLAPDVGLTLMTAGAAVYFPAFEDMTMQEAMEHAFGTLFFEDPIWITVQNTFHSPVVLAGLFALGKVTKSNKLMAFAAGAMLHTAMDIPVHHNDGPLVFFPFNWDYRFDSPVSYYDRDFYGGIVAPVDMAMTVLGGGYLARQWWKNRSFF